MDFDQVKLAAVIAAFLFSWRAMFVTALFYLSSYIFTLEITGAEYSFLIVLLYCFAATNIKFKSEIRQALWAIAALNWLCMIDYAYFPYETMFYHAYPFLIHVIDCYIIYHLLSHGGRQDVGTMLDAAQDFIFSTGYRILWLSRIYRQSKR